MGVAVLVEPGVREVRGEKLEAAARPGELRARPGELRACPGELRARPGALPEARLEELPEGRQGVRLASLEVWLPVTEDL